MDLAKPALCAISPNVRALMDGRWLPIPQFLKDLAKVSERHPLTSK